MAIFRSEDMYFYKFTCFKDNAWKVMNELGKLDSFDFVDLNKNEQPFNLPYGNTLKRREESLRNLINIETECTNIGIDLKEPDSIEELNESIDLLQKNMK